MPKLNESKLVNLLQVMGSSRILVGEEPKVAKDGFREEGDLFDMFFSRKVLKAQKLKFGKLGSLKMMT